MNFDMFLFKFVHFSREKGISRCMFGHSFAHPSLLPQVALSMNNLLCCRFLIDTGKALTQCLQHHSCAIQAGGMLKCWGFNAYGEVMLFFIIIS